MAREQGLLQVTISSFDWQNTIEFLVCREVHSCTRSVLRVVFSKLGNLDTRDWEHTSGEEQSCKPGSFPERDKIARH